MDVTQFKTPYEESEGPCQICHYSVDDCTCPECRICGVFGDPACINTHMNFKEWGHFKFEPSARELKEAEENFAKQFEMESKMFDDLPGLNEYLENPEEELNRRGVDNRPVE